MKQGENLKFIIISGAWGFNQANQNISSVKTKQVHTYAKKCLLMVHSGLFIINNELNQIIPSRRNKFKEDWNQ